MPKTTQQRDASRYGQRRPLVYRPDGVPIERPTEGLFKMRMIRGGVKAAIRIWYGPPLDPWDGTELDRCWRWMATVNGEPVELERVWPACTKEPIDEAEYRHIMKTAEWAKQHAPDSAVANPRRKMDALKDPISF